MRLGLVDDQGNSIRVKNQNRITGSVAPPTIYGLNSVSQTIISRVLYYCLYQAAV